MVKRKHRIAQHAQNHCHFATVKQVEQLEEVFAKLTPKGWQVPEWLVLMKLTARR